MKKFREMVKNLRMVKKALFLLLLISMIAMNSFAQRVTNAGDHFFVAFGKNGCITNSQVSGYYIELILRITTMDADANVTLHFKNNPTLDITFNVKAGTIFDYILSDDQAKSSYSALGGYNLPNNTSIEVSSDSPIILVAVSTANASVEATQIFPVSKLGTEYINSGMEVYTGSSGQQGVCDHYDSYMVIATEDNTNITHYIGVNTYTSNNLQKGQVIYVPATKKTAPRVVANKPVAFFQSGTYSEIGTRKNHTFEQLAPTNQWGTKFILPTNDLNAIFGRIYAKDDQTTVTLKFSDGTNPETYLISGTPAQRYKDVRIDADPNLPPYHPNAKACYIETSAPVSVCIYHLDNLGNHALGNMSQPGVAWLPPMEQRTRNVLVSPLDLNGRHVYLEIFHHLLIIAPTASRDKTTISINGNTPLSVQNINEFTWWADSIGGSDYSFGRYCFGTSHPGATPPRYLNITTMIDNPDGIIVLAYGQGSYTNYFYAAGDAGRDLEQAPDWVRLREAVNDLGAETVTVYPLFSPIKEQLIGTHYDLVLTEHQDSIYSDGAFININHNVSINFDGNLPTDTLILYTENSTDGRHFQMSGNATKTFAFDKVALDGGNKAGGIDASAGTNTITGVAIQNCISVGVGGGINASSPVTLNNVIIKNCKAGYNNGVWNINGSGGGICASDALTITHSTIDGCQAGGYGGGIQCADADISYSTIQKNKAAMQGNRALVGGGINSTNSITMAHSAVKNNSCISNAGGINATNLTLTGDIEISDNTSGFFGGGIKTKNIDLSNIAQLIVKNNEATEDGGGMYVNNDLIFPNNAVVEISGNISIDGDGGGIHVEDGVLHIAGHFTVANNKAGNNGGGLSVYDPTTLTTHGNNIIFSDNEAINPYWIKHDDLYRGILGTNIINTHAPAHPPLKHNTFSEPPTINAPFEYAYNNFDVNWAPKNGTTSNPLPFQIWNWADLAYLNVLIENEYQSKQTTPVYVGLGEKISDYSEFLLMQDLFSPDSLSKFPTSGIGCDYESPRNKGCYGYQNWNGNSYITSGSLKVGGNNTAELTTIPISYTAITDNYCWDENGWNPIGRETFGLSRAFTGIFHGKGFVVNGLLINRHNVGQGLFGHVENAVIDSLGVNGNVTADNSSSAGVLAGEVIDCEISHCYAIGKVQGNNYIGGLIGDLKGGDNNVSNCYAEVMVKGYRLVGGLVGSVVNAQINNCYAGGSVAGDKDVGGMIGNADKVQLLNGYATGDVASETEYAGGLIGIIFDSEIENCYATGNLSGTTQYIGGFIGDMYRTQVSNSYSTGNITGTNSYAGGFVGQVRNLSKITNCFAFCSQVSGTQNVGRIAGVIDNATLKNNYALTCMRVNDTLVSPTNPHAIVTDIHGANIDIESATTPAIFKRTPYANDWDWTTAWDFVTPPGTNVKVAEGTNLPVLRAFDISTSIFFNTIQKAIAICLECTEPAEIIPIHEGVQPKK